MLKIIGAGLILMLTSCVQNSTSDDYISQNVKLYDAGKLDKLVEAQKLEVNDRVETLKSLRLSLKSTYVGYDLKKKLIGKSGDEILDACISREELIKRPSSNHAFAERVTRCLADFRDTHLSLQKSARSARVITAIAEGLLLNNRFYIGTIRAELIEKLIALGRLKVEDKKAIIAGSEIIEMDGQPMSVRIKELGGYLSISSELARYQLAAQMMFNRGLAYPVKPNCSLKIRTSNNQIYQVELPWVMLSPVGDMLETPYELLKADILPASDLGEQSLLQPSGFDQSDDIPFELLSENKYDVNGKPAISLKIVKLATERNPVCYLKLNTFSFPQASGGVYLVANQYGAPINLLAELESFLRACNDQQSKLIVDLRHNVGGDMLLSVAFTALFEKADSSITIANMFRFKSGSNSFFLNSVDVTENESPAIWRTRREALLRTVDKKMPFTPWIVFMNKTLKRNVYKNKFVVLIGPQCISACESVVQRLKMGGNAKTIGLPTNGTGFGFVMSGSSMSGWTDPNQLLLLKIPNQAFTNSERKFSPLFEDDDHTTTLFDHSELSVQENSPQTPHVRYELSFSDIPNFKVYKSFIEKNLK